MKCEMCKKPGYSSGSWNRVICRECFYKAGLSKTFGDIYSADWFGYAATSAVDSMIISFKKDNGYCPQCGESHQ